MPSQQFQRARVAAHVEQEAAVDLDLVERQGVEIAEAGIAGAEIVQGDPHAHLPHFLDEAARHRLVVEQGRLRHLDLQAISRQVRCLQRFADVVDDVAIAEVPRRQVHRYADVFRPLCAFAACGP